VLRRLALLLLVISVAACAGLPGAGGSAPRTVVLVSLDGFRPGDLGRGLTPTLDAMAREGVAAEGMRPSYPTLTFPNHYTLVTGLRPDRHGIVHNTIEDATLGTFRNSDRDAVRDARWWGGEPLWSTAEKHGLPTATMFWPGSEAPIGGVYPGEYRAFDESVTAAARTDTVLGWLSRPAAERPRFVTLYFEHLDEASHDAGPDSDAARAAIRILDAEIARLRSGIAARGLTDSVDLVIVSDHGMAEVAPDHVLAVEDIVPPDLARYVTTGQSIGVAPLAGRGAEAMRAIVGRHAHHECWTRETLPARWQFGRHPRVPPIVCQMDEGWDANTRKRIEERPRVHERGSHGYDPALPSMAALFVADGPSFRDGVRLPAFDNVHVYPLLARLLGIPPRPSDGDPAVLAPALR
jgi:predicted AlkP superfamily pyrophosphatase or phosphodiesterase